MKPYRHNPQNYNTILQYPCLSWTLSPTAYDIIQGWGVALTFSMSQEPLHPARQHVIATLTPLGFLTAELKPGFRTACGTWGRHEGVNRWRGLTHWERGTLSVRSLSFSSHTQTQWWDWLCSRHKNTADPVLTGRAGWAKSAITCEREEPRERSEKIKTGRGEEVWVGKKWRKRNRCSRDAAETVECKVARF